MTKSIQVVVPDIGDFSDIPVIEVMVAVGDAINEGDTIAVLESDKSTLEIPSETTGNVTEVHVSENDVVSQGSRLLTLLVDEDAPVIDEQTSNTATQPAASPDSNETLSKNEPITPATEQPPQQPGDHQFATTQSSRLVHATPSVRRFARSLGVGIAAVSGTGPKARITREDIKAFVKDKLTNNDSMAISGLPPWPSIDYAKYGPVERTPISRIKQISGPALSRNAMLIPHVTHFDKADITELEQFRQQLNREATGTDAKITLLTFAVKAIVSTLKAYPQFNSSLDGDELVVKNYWNIGFAANTPAGLLVPVVKQADTKSLRQIATDITTLAEHAREGKLASTDMQGATFTISSLGGVGGTNFTPIINAPEVAILGLPRAETQPVWDGESFQPRLIQPLSLSFDHRVIDGVEGAHFLARVGSILNDLRRADV